MLDVSDTTLRQWADSGYIRVYRTPGGHRRFLKDDVEAFAKALQSGQPTNGKDGLLTPLINQVTEAALAGELDDRVIVAKINIDENPQTPAKYGVRGIPTLLIFKDGQVASMKIGSLPKSQLYEWVESVL